MTTGEQLQDITKSAVPLLIVAGLLWGALQVGGYIERLQFGTSDIDRRFQQVEEARKADLAPIVESMKELRSSIEDVRKVLQDPTSRAIPTDILRYSDLYVFCLQLKVGNPSLNLGCDGGMAHQHGARN